MRRLLAVAVLVVAARSASAQVMPPSISKPIEAAKRATNATNEQTRAVEQVGNKPGATQAKPSAPPPAPGKGMPAAQAKPGAPVVQAPAKSAATPAPVRQETQAQDTQVITFQREVFTYVAGGRRDPFASPIETGEIRPLIADLRVSGIIYDPRGRSSVAVMRDMSTQQQYRVKTGQMLGRAKVAQIRPQEVVMTIDEYGFSRQEILKLNMQQTQQTKGKP